MKNVDLDITNVDRTTPVRLILRDSRSASMEYKRATFSITKDNVEEVMEVARTQVSRWAANAGVDVLSVHIYDMSESAPELSILLGTAEGDFLADEGITSAEKTAAERSFTKWQDANIARGSHRGRPSRPVAARRPVEPETDLGLFDQEPEPAEEPVEEVAEVTTKSHLFDPVVHHEPLTVTRQAAPEPKPETYAAVSTAGSSPFTVHNLMAEGKNDQRAQIGFRGVINRTLNTQLAPNEYELKRRGWIDDIVRGWDGTKFVDVINTKGGAFKTPGSLMLAATMAEYTSMNVAVMDNNEGAGNAKARIDVANEHNRTSKHLAEFSESHPDMSDSDLEYHMLRHRADRYHVLASHEPGLDDPGLSREQVAELHSVFSRFYRLGIMDSGNSWATDAWVGMIERGHQLVVPMVTVPDRVAQAQKVLDMVYNFGPDYEQLALNAVIVVSQWQPQDVKLRQKYAAMWEEMGFGSRVIQVPYDSHLGSHNLRLSSLRPATRDAFLQLGAAVARGLRGEVG